MIPNDRPFLAGEFSAAELNLAAVLLHLFQVKKAVFIDLDRPSLLVMSKISRANRLQSALNKLMAAGLIHTVQKNDHEYIYADGGFLPLVALSENFTKMPMRDFLDLRGKYAKRMAVIIQSWASAQNFTYSHTTLCARLGVRDSLARHFPNFERRVLGPAVNEIQTSRWRFEGLKPEGNTLKKRTYTFDLKPAVSAFRSLAYSDKLAGFGLTQYQIDKALNYLTDKQISLCIQSCELQKINGKLNGQFAPYLWVALRNLIAENEID